VDLVGTIIVPAMILLLSAGSFLFGWAKPVPVNFGRLRHPKQDMLWVAAAGPGVNLLMALGWGLLLKMAVAMPVHGYSQAMAEMARVGININGVLMVLNLLPLPPLDGGRIAVSLLPHRQAAQFSQIEPYGMVILLALLFTGVLETILGPLLGLFMMLMKSFLSL
jgi:Zn-dependent protease